MKLEPFLVRFAVPTPKEENETSASQIYNRDVIDIQNKQVSTIFTKVDRETTDDR